MSVNDYCGSDGLFPHCGSESDQYSLQDPRLLEVHHFPDILYPSEILTYRQCWEKWLSRTVTLLIMFNLVTNIQKLTVGGSALTLCNIYEREGVGLVFLVVPPSCSSGSWTAGVKSLVRRCQNPSDLSSPFIRIAASRSSSYTTGGVIKRRLLSHFLNYV